MATKTKLQKIAESEEYLNDPKFLEKIEMLFGKTYLKHADDYSDKYEQTDFILEAPCSSNPEIKEQFKTQGKLANINSAYKETDKNMMHFTLCKKVNRILINGWATLPSMSMYTMLVKRTRGCHDYVDYPIFLIPSEEIYIIMSFIYNHPDIQEAIATMYEKKLTNKTVYININSPKLFEIKLLLGKGVIDAVIHRANYDRLALMNMKDRNLFAISQPDNDLEQTKKEATMFLRESKNRLEEEVKNLNKQLNNQEEKLKELKYHLNEIVSPVMHYLERKDYDEYDSEKDYEEIDMPSYI